MITLAGPAVSVWDQGAYALRQKLAQSPDMPVELKAQVTALSDELHLLMQLLIEGRRTEFLKLREELVRRMQPLAVFGSIYGLPSYEPPKWSERSDVLNSMDAMIDYDPLPPLRKVKCPVLAVFGGHDQVVDSEQSARLFNETLKGAGNENCTTKIFPGADHGINIEGKPAPGLQQLLLTWVQDQVRKTTSR